MSEQRLFRFTLPFHVSPQLSKDLSMYLAGAFFSLGLWLLVDASLYSKTVNASLAHVTFIDWIPFICSTLGTIVVNSLDKVQLINEDSFDYGGSSLQRQARVVLFIGFALLAGGMSGSVLILVMKFIVKGFTEMPTVGMGLENVASNACVMASCCLIWLMSNIEDDNSLML
ncbi:Vps68 protein [Martiniozyma asiatica (nom. inval.)]|nr:Vps68 protein [Martiniozyma asiatica]